MWTDDLHKLIYAHVVLIGVPTIFYYCLRLGGYSLVNVHVAIATFFLVSSVMMLLEASSALLQPVGWLTKMNSQGRRRLHYSALRSLGRLKLEAGSSPNTVTYTALPRCSVLIAAYLPNEQGIILDTLRHVLYAVRHSPAGLEVILTYNTPEDLPIEDDLKQLAARHPELRLLRVEGSLSKAENINAALELVTGEITCILDADHQPSPDCFERAWYWLQQGYDVVQGRNIIRNHRSNLLTQTIAVEFESVYGVSHTAKSVLTDSTIFGGSNGYWRSSVLKQIRFNPGMLTEDIDASLRTLLSGYRILHDRSIVTTELAPDNFTAFWFQRKRWSQGWLEVGIRYQRRVWKSKHFTPWQKLYWTYLLYYYGIFAVAALQILPLILSLWLYQGSLPPSHNSYLWFCTVIAFCSGFYQTLITGRIAAARYPILYFIQHIVLLFAYAVLKNTIAVVAIYDYLHGQNKWVVTPRADQGQYPVPEEIASQLLASTATSSNYFE